MAREPREVWEKRVERWRESGMSAAEFAAEIGVNHHTLSHWAWRVGKASRGECSSERPSPRKRRATSVAVAPAIEAAGFVELVPSAAPHGGVADGSTGAHRSGERGFEVVLATGRTVRVPASFDGEALRRLLAVLEVT